jgi:hypothetical protein
MGRKKIKSKLGDIFTFSIAPNKHCFGQIIAVTEYGLFDNFYVLFDLVSEGIPDISEIVNKPVWLIGPHIGVSIKDGEWPVIGNTEIVIKNLKLPYFIEPFSTGEILVNYYGKRIRKATKQDLKEYYIFRNMNDDIFVDLAKLRYEGVEWDHYFDYLLYDEKKWTRSDDEPAELEEVIEYKSEDELEDKDDFIDITIQFKLDSEGFGTLKDLKKRHSIEDLLEKRLDKAGLGGCDGAEIGNGEMLVFCYVTDAQKGLDCIKEELAKHGFLEKAVISVEE